MNPVISIDFSVLAVFISLASLVVISSTTLFNIAINGKHFRLGFILAWILTLISVIAIIFVLRPVESALLGVLLITGSMSIFLVFLVRQHYRTSFLKDDDVSQSTRINQLHHADVNYILSSIISGLYNKDMSKVPNRDRTLQVHISNFHEAFKVTSRHIEFRSSILETLPDGTFDIACATPNIDLHTLTRMKERFRWKPYMKSTAGKCVCTRQYVLCKNIQVQEDREKSGWVSLNENESVISEEGCVLSIPIPYPKNYRRSDDTACLGVLSIACDKPNYLTEAHAQWIEKWYIDALTNIILLYRLHDVLKQAHLENTNN